MPDVVHEIPNNFKIKQDLNTGQYSLEVVCGHVGTFNIQVEIDEDLARKAITDPSVLTSLLNDIRSDPHSFQNKIKLI